MLKENLKRHNNKQEDTRILKSNELKNAELIEANNSDVNLEEVKSMFVSMFEDIQKQKSTESIKSSEFCKIINLIIMKNDNNEEEEEEEKDFNDDEKPSAYEAGDSVDEIQ